jgi:hypothetical protein
MDMREEEREDVWKKALKTKGVIKDEWVVMVLEELNMPRDRTFWPPVLGKVSPNQLRWDSESMAPAVLGERLFRDTKFEVDGNEYMTEEQYGWLDDWKGRQKKLKETAAALQKVMLENCGYHMFYNTTSGMPRSKLKTGEVVTFCCYICKKKDPKMWIPLMRVVCCSEKEDLPRKTREAAREKQQRKEKVTVEGKGRKEKKERSKKASDDDGGKRKFYFEIQDVYMHSCKAPKNAPWTEEVGIDLRDSSGEVEGGGEHNGGGTYIEKSGGERLLQN